MKKMNYTYETIGTMRTEELNDLITTNRSTITKATALEVYNELYRRRQQEGFNKCVLGIS